MTTFEKAMLEDIDALEQNRTAERFEDLQPVKTYEARNIFARAVDSVSKGATGIDQVEQEGRQKPGKYTDENGKIYIVGKDGNKYDTSGKRI